MLHCWNFLYGDICFNEGNTSTVSFFLSFFLIASFEILGGYVSFVDCARPLGMVHQSPSRTFQKA